MPKGWNANSFRALLTAVLLVSLISLVSVKPVSAAPGKQVWSVIDTPGSDNNSILSPSEINVIAIGSDDRTVYVVDIPNKKVYKSINSGVWWPNEISGYLTTAGANLPVWNLALAPDNVNFLVAVTDGTGGPGGPKMVFVSENGGTTWQIAMTGLTLAFGEYISCVDISVTYGGTTRDIAIGTRDGAGFGRVLVMKTGLGFNSWMDQSLGGDVVALKFSPAYTSDSTLLVVSADGTGTFLHLGFRDTAINTTDWVTWVPVEITTAGPGTSPKSNEIITADLELPSDFLGSAPNFRRFYVSTDAVAGVQSGVYRVDDTIPYRINPPIPITRRISSIAYRGTYAEGVLLAGEVTSAEFVAGPSSYGVYVWRTSDPMQTTGTPTWLNSDDRKSPTGGVGIVPGFANAQLAWSPNGTRAYCGTSSADFVNGGTSMIAGSQCWPEALLNGVPFDESALSVSPYSPDYEGLLNLYGKPTDIYIGNIWNQLSLIDTQIIQLDDVAVLQVPETAGSPTDYNILYLVSADGVFVNIWRSTSDPPGRTWERILRVSATNELILRVKQTTYDEAVRSRVIVYADLNTQTVGYSGDEGQLWDVGLPFPSVTDLTLASDELMYILNGSIVYRYVRVGTAWQRTHEVHSELDSGHTIAVPLKNPKNDVGDTADWVVVGEAGPPVGFSRVAWADFSQVPVKFEPSIDGRVELPVPGNVHVIADDKFEANETIYAASHDVGDTSGKIYRWVIDASTAWDELEPPNSAFYGLAMRNDILYGAWDLPTPPNNQPGADRTLFPRANVPPPPEWDYLTEGLPVSGINYPAAFTREPSSLKISSNEDIELWAIDNDLYDWPSRTGCLWAYTDTVAKVGPWTTSPASGDFIPVDPVTGRASEVDFKWRQLSYAEAYELQVAKDKDFSIMLLRQENIIPTDPLAPECYFPAGGLVPVPASGIANWGNLESGHTYYWRVRARYTVTGEAVRSPWSATMYFTVGAGFPVMSRYSTITLFSPPYGVRGVSRAPSFSWSPMPKTTRYEFVLAKDAALQQVVVKTNVPLTSYMYDGKLDFGTSYFWQVRVVEPIVSDPSPIGIFTVMAEEKPAQPVTEEPSPVPLWTWGVIAICAVLVATIIAYAMVKPGGYAVRRKTTVEIKFDTDRPENPIARIWKNMTMGAKRLRPSSKRGERDSGDKPE